MEKGLEFKYGSVELKISGLDKEKEVEVIIEDLNTINNEIYIYLNKDDLVSLKEHIEYLLNK